MNRLRALAVSAVLALALAAACGKAHNPVDDILTSAPAGTVAGQPWTMTKATVRNSGDSLSVTLLSGAVADCATSSQDAGYIIFSVPAKVGSRPLQLSLSNLFSPDNQTLTFVTPPSSNNISVDGVIDITDVSDAGVTMGLIAKAAPDSVNGTFTTAFCK